MILVCIFLRSFCHLSCGLDERKPFFPISGTVELLSELLKRFVKGRVMVSAVAFRILLFIQSGPQAFPVSRLFKIAVISSVFS